MSGFTISQKSLEVGDEFTIAGHYLPVPWYRRFWAWIRCREVRRVHRVYRVVGTDGTKVTYQ